MGWTALPLPVVWAQATGSATSNPIALAPLALRRWCGGLTLCSPESVPSLFGLWVWLAGLGGLLLLAALLQGPRAALKQVFDVPGHVRLWAAANRRLWRSGRMLAATVGLTVLSWTGSQTLTFSKPGGRDDLVMLTRARGLGELAVEQGVFAGLTPLRDVAGLGSNAPLLVLTVLLLFRASSEHWGGEPPPGLGRRRRLPPWANLAWLAGAALILYRLFSIGYGMNELPLGGSFLVEALVVPALLAACDGLLLGWVLVELRGDGLDDAGDDDGVDVRGAAVLWPAATLACLAALPARYLATAAVLASDALPASAGATAAGAWARWQLSGGLAQTQGGSLVFAGLAGAAAWSGGSPAGAFRGYGRMLARDGGRLAVVLALAGLAAASAAAVAYLAVLSLPTATWVLTAADSYAHYATLPVGLWTLAALVELGERALPEATLTPLSPSKLRPVGTSERM